jgi:hypothetical protein
MAKATLNADRMGGVAGLVTSQDVTTSYIDVGLDFAGGSPVPSVSATVAGNPYGTLVTTILAKFFCGSPILTLPDISVTFTGEDLSSAGA